eukprot:1313529-Amphidinium_carterae.1
MLAYTARKLALMKELGRAGLDLPETAKGLSILRDAKLNKTELDSVTFWSRGEFDAKVIIDCLRRLERPTMSAQTSGPSTGLSSMFYQDQDQDEQTWEAEEWPEEAEVLEEEEAQWIWAQGQGQTGRPMSYRQARSNMNQHKLARGYPPTATTANAATAGTAGKGKKGKGKRDLDEIIKKSRCARCGQIGHWAR